MVSTQFPSPPQHPTSPPHSHAVSEYPTSSYRNNSNLIQDESKESRLPLCLQILGGRAMNNQPISQSPRICYLIGRYVLYEVLGSQCKKFSSLGGDRLVQSNCVSSMMKVSKSVQTDSSITLDSVILKYGETYTQYPRWGSWPEGLHIHRAAYPAYYKAAVRAFSDIRVQLGLDLTSLVNRRLGMADDS